MVAQMICKSIACMSGLAAETVEAKALQVELWEKQPWENSAAAVIIGFLEALV